jgi:hypothetical protein
VALVVTLAALMAGCSTPLVLDETLPQQIETIGCISQCEDRKTRCDDDARFDYAQCEADYKAAWRGYRRCNARSDDNCGYPWWRCAENRYGYCSNRYWECREDCIRTFRTASR